MKPFETLREALAPDGTALKLVRRGDEYLILADGGVLMSNRMHGSEEALATFACERLRSAECPTVLIGGLGMGFTLRATLDLLSPGAMVIVAELSPAVVEWNEGPLGPFAGHPLEDHRVKVEIGDVGAAMASRSDAFDAVMLDVDNGPAAFTVSRNGGLYDEQGIATAYAALKKQGVLAVWAVQEYREYEKRCRKAGFDVRVRNVRGRLKAGGPRHVVYLNRKIE